MRALTADEKLAIVMVYTQNMLVRGEMIVSEGVRVSIWLRTQGVSNFVHLLRPQAVLLGSGSPKSITYSEMYVPTNQLIAFHLAPPAADPLDYEASEVNRSMTPVTALVGSFMLKAKLRHSSQTDLAASLDVLRSTWISLYEAEITHPAMPQFDVRVPMLLVNSNVVGFGV